MVEKYIFAGVEYKEGEQKGVYRFNWQEDSNHIFDESAHIQTVDHNNNLRSPRAIKCVKDKLHVFVRDTLLSADAAYDESVGGDEGIITKIKLADCLENFSAVDIDRIVGEGDNTRGSMQVLYDRQENVKDFYFGFYSADRIKWEVKPGRLFHSSSGDISKLQLVDGSELTGDLIETDGSISATNGTKLTKIVSGTYLDMGDQIYGEERKKVKIIAASSCDGLTICTDNLEGYFVDDRGHSYYQMQNVGKVVSGERRWRPLVSAATSVKAVKKDGDYYALFGADEGRLLLYDIKRRRGRPAELVFNKLVNFLSLESICHDKKKSRDDYIRHLDYDAGWISFTLRNLYMVVDFKNLLSIDPRVRIDFSEEQPPFTVDERGRAQVDPATKKLIPNAEYEKYLKTIKNRYGMEQICAAPHRIVCLDTARIK